MTFTIDNPVLSNAVPATKSLPDKGKDQKVPSLTRLVHHSHVTTEFDPLRFEAAASLQLQLQLEKQYPDTETDTRLIASPYNSVPHLLDISALERQDRLFALALAYLKPIRDDYATAEYTESFNWTEVYDLLRTFSQAENHAWKSQSYYVVIFRSILLPDIDSDRLYDLDAHSHQEAIASGGLLKYWFGAKNDKHRNLATCKYLIILSPVFFLLTMANQFKQAFGAIEMMRDLVVVDLGMLKQERLLQSCMRRLSSPR